MRKEFLVIGIVVLIVGVILLGISGIRQTKFIARSINDDQLRAYLEAGKYHIHASYSVPEDHPTIRIYDSYDNLFYEKDYAPESNFEVPYAGFYSIHVTNMQEQNSVLEVSRILYPFKNSYLLGISLIALGIAFAVVGVIKEQRVVGLRPEP